MKQLASTYTISGSAVTLTGVNVPLSQILLVSDATTGNVLYSMAGPAASNYTQATNSVITLATAPGASDKLTIYYDDGVAPANAPTTVSVSNLPSTQPVSGTVTANVTFPTTQAISATSLPLPTGAAQDGVDGTGITAPTGGSGIRGWLSGIYAALTGTPSVGAVSATNTVSTTGIVPSAGNLLINSTDVSAYRSVTIQTTVSGGGGTYQAQVSADGTNWVFISGQYSGPTPSGSSTFSYLSGSSGYTIGSSLTTFSLIGARYFRVYVYAGSGGGTVATTAFFSSIPVQQTLVQDSNNNLLVAGTVTASTPSSVTYSYSYTGTINSGSLFIPIIDCSQFKELTLQSVSLGTGGTGFTVQISNDNFNWLTASAGASASSTTLGTTSQAAGLIICYPTYGAKYVRVLTNGTITAGTTTAYAQLSQIPTPKTFINAALSSQVFVPNPNIAQGFSTFFTLVSAAGTNATSVKASGGTIGTCVLTNTTALPKYVKLFNKASSPTVGTDTPVIQFPIGANSTLDVSSSFAGMRLSSGIALATTGGSALLDNTSVAAGDILVNMTYV